MPGCSILGCRAYKRTHLPNLTMHRLPKKDRQKWLDIIGVENINLQFKEPRICSLHFDDKSFNRTLDVIRLRDEALPSSDLIITIM
ncbi:hypothetical protein HW555_005880 [Spodoptera exigua]|uniref:THAP-type domain-containing protein n=1 Tax=Spodoptera exigua TaxID=7107 RepID=A0A835GI68_SPOEX|nr:hypothetical protein HW555_005880 [Spodoptera exigua]